MRTEPQNDPVTGRAPLNAEASAPERLVDEAVKAQSVATPKRRPMLTHLHAFRAVAILFIVAGHCVRLFDWGDTPRVELFLLDALENGTVLFVFIAGYLFEYLSGKFEYRSYASTKLRNVILPYLIISVPALIHDVLITDPSINFPQLAGTGWVQQVCWFLVQGGAGINFPMWFIPMIALFYVAAPAFMQFVKRPGLYAILPVLVVVSLLLHRPSHARFDTLAQALYYLPAYLAGMWASHARERLEPLLIRYWLPLSVTLGVMLVAQWRWSPFHGNYGGLASFSQENGLIDWLFLQKFLMCFVLLGLMGRWYRRRIPAVDYVADLSFPVFFLHAYFIFVFGLFFSEPPPGNPAIFFATVGTIFGASIILAASVKKLLGDRSRWVLGG
jgi:surface polysaccharide O-acyltransferase-like enzyme